jgi:hypothetical protein
MDTRAGPAYASYHHPHVDYPLSTLITRAGRIRALLPMSRATGRNGKQAKTSTVTRARGKGMV